MSESFLAGSVNPAQAAPVEPFSDDAHVARETAQLVHRFSGKMLNKMQYHQQRFRDCPWNERKWSERDLQVEIFQALREGDYISVANYAMIGDRVLSAPATGGKSL